MLANDVTLGVDEHQRGPSPAGILLPDLELAVVDYRVLQLVTPNGLIDVVGLLLVWKFGRVDADHSQLVGVLYFQFPQLRKYVGAVDSTISPEVQDHDPAPEFLNCYRAVRVNPLQSLRELGRGQFAGELTAVHGASAIAKRPAAQMDAGRK